MEVMLETSKSDCLFVVVDMVRSRGCLSLLRLSTKKVRGLAEALVNSVCLLSL
jgi:hypothetical protein